ncbi:rhomboid-like protein [Actinosynnema sp. NPDC020468]|uniref:rhomboid-like protein n=1 Tax=Actinosynnema sp. NPDC020468 TaxID=3154488 RepID=UPI0033C39293
MRELLRRYPVTAGYLLVVTGLAVLMGFVFADGMSAQVRESLSTNLHNLGDHPVNALLGSAFVLATDDGVVFTLVAAAGLAVCLGALERAVGAWRAAAVVLVGHVGATVVAASVIASGVYGVDLSRVEDVGISYVAFSAAGAVTVLVPGVLRGPWLALLAGYPLVDAEWFGWVPDFGSIGHLCAVVLGVAGGVVAYRRVYSSV